MSDLNKVPSISQVPNGRAAMWWVIASEIVIFGGLIVIYLLYRIRFPEWEEIAKNTSTPMGALNTFVLLTSSFTVVLAHQAAIQKKGDKAWKYLLATIGLGFVFLIVKSFEYYTEIKHGFTITSHLYWSFYYLMTGLHALHIIVGMVALFVVGLSVKRGKNYHRVEMAGLYWHFVDVVWIFLFPLLYMAK